MARLRVLTVNVQNEEGEARRMQVLNQGLRELAPDLVAFQEVAHTTGKRQLQSLLEGTGLKGVHQAEVLRYTPPWADRYGGCAIASRWTPRVVETLDLRLAEAPDVPWVAMAAVVLVPGAGELLLVGATSSWRLDAEAARERQAVALTDLDARHRRPVPTVIAGDFNATPESASVRYLTGLQSIGGRSVHYHDAWAVAGAGPGYTWTVDNPRGSEEIEKLVGQPGHRRRIDYVFVGSRHAHPEVSCTIQSATLAFDRPVDGVWASDHLGVLVDMEVGQ